VRKILLIAQRDYLQIVRSKAYLVGLIVFPVLIGGGFLAVSLMNRGAPKEQRIAILDRTQVSAAAIIQAWEESRREAAAADPTRGLRGAPRFTFETIKPDSDQTAQLITLSNRIHSGELFLVLDIPASSLSAGDVAKPEPIRYYTNSTGLDQSLASLTGAVNNGLKRVRLAQAGVDDGRIPGVLRNVPLVAMNLVGRNPNTGKVLQGEKRSPVQTLLLPLFLVYLLAIITLVGAAPNLGGVAEDKMQRVFEMLLTAASPFDLMMGKVLASLGASMTTSVLYILAGLLALAGMAMFGLAPLHLIPWFFMYLIAGVALLSALGAALGAACATPQDAQHLAFLLFIPIFIPLIVVTPIVQQPNSAFAVTMSFLPPFTPVVMLLRQSMPAGVPWWQPCLALVGVIAWGIAVVWGAARIFRIGILSQGKTPKFGELAQWVVRG
jgi:ABC-2 type transport system permease protein